jgi:FHA domain
MPVCPAGHDSSATDFCDVCGMRIGGAAAASPASAASQASGSVQAAPAEPCPQCGTERTGQFCEGCGFDFSSGTPARTAAPASTITGQDPAGAPTTGSSGQDTASEPATGPSGQATASSPAAGTGPTWTAVVTADRGYFDRVIAAGGPDASTIEFPAYCPERRFPLSGKEVRVGRRSASRGLEPEIDLSGPPADPGISHLHAVLIAQPDGGWSVLDPGSANGTQVNGMDIGTGVAVPLQPGARISIGAWTVLTLQT